MARERQSLIIKLAFLFEAYAEFGSEVCTFDDRIFYMLHQLCFSYDCKGSYHPYLEEPIVA